MYVYNKKRFDYRKAIFLCNYLFRLRSQVPKKVPGKWEPRPLHFPEEMEFSATIHSEELNQDTSVDDIDYLPDEPSFCSSRCCVGENLIP